MIRFIMILELVFFFIAGTQIVERERECAKMEAVSAILLHMPPKALTEVRI